MGTTIPVEPTAATGAQLYDLADALAAVAHAGQVRKGEGEPYVNHVRRVAFRVTGWRAKTVALLHDLIEDTTIDRYVLTRIGFPADVVNDVLALTRRIDPVSMREETYEEFITRTIRDGSLDALRVKVADLQDNLNDPWVETTKLATRYIPAAARILDEIDRRTSR